MRKANTTKDSDTFWDEIANSFDEEPDHGLRDPAVRQAWTALIQNCFPGRNSSILDIGCGTGSLSLVLAGLGHQVTGVDLSPAMISIAKSKAQAQNAAIPFQVMDAAYPEFQLHQFNSILCRHLLWALPEPDQVLLRWADLLKPHGRLVLIEGYWGSGTGLHADEIIKMLPPAFARVSVQKLSDNTSLWGKTVTDERYAILADLE